MSEREDVGIKLSKKTMMNKFKSVEAAKDYLTSKGFIQLSSEVWLSIDIYTEARIETNLHRGTYIQYRIDESELKKNVWNAAVEKAAQEADKQLAGRLAARIRELKK